MIENFKDIRRNRQLERALLKLHDHFPGELSAENIGKAIGSVLAGYIATDELRLFGEARHAIYLREGGKITPEACKVIVDRCLSNSVIGLALKSEAEMWCNKISILNKQEIIEFAVAIIGARWHG